MKAKPPKGKPGGTDPTPGAAADELPERWSVQRKTELVMRLLRGEALDAMSRENQVPAHEMPGPPRAAMALSHRVPSRHQKAKLDAEDRHRVMPHQDVDAVHVATSWLGRRAFGSDAHLQTQPITWPNWLQQFDTQVVAAKEGPFQVRRPIIDGMHGAAPKGKGVAAARDEAAERCLLRRLHVHMEWPRIVLPRIVHHRVRIDDDFLSPEDGALREVFEGYQPGHRHLRGVHP